MLPHNAGDVGKSLAFCKAPDWTMGGKKGTRKSDKGKRGRIEVSRFSYLLVYTHPLVAVYVFVLSEFSGI